MDSVSVRMDEFIGTFLLIINGHVVLQGNFLASVPIGFMFTVMTFATGGAGAPPRSVTGSLVSVLYWLLVGSTLTLSFGAASTAVDAAIVESPFTDALNFLL